MICTLRLGIRFAVGVLNYSSHIGKQGDNMIIRIVLAILILYFIVWKQVIQPCMSYREEIPVLGPMFADHLTEADIDDAYYGR